MASWTAVWAFGGDFYALPRSFTLSQPSDYYKVKDVSVNATLNHKLTDWLSFNAAYMKFIYHEGRLSFLTEKLGMPCSSAPET